MTTTDALTRHYTTANLLEAIHDGISRLGKTTASVGIDDLAPLDEFHVGGREASQALLDPLAFSGKDHVLDIGCGLGGTARHVAQRYGCRVSGVDLTPAFIETGRLLCEWLELTGRVALHHGDALALPFADASFDAAYMMHVGMNIADKSALFAEVARAVRRGGKLALYELMRTGDCELAFPVPWATSAGESFVAGADDYRRALETAGFSIVAQRNRRDYALSFFETVRNKVRQADGPPPLGLHLVMGELAGTKYRNMAVAVGEGLLAPIEMVAVRNAG